MSARVLMSTYYNPSSITVSTKSVNEALAARGSNYACSETAGDIDGLAENGCEDGRSERYGDSDGNHL